eukprot:Nitzschia sp. Nitz4//scaffold316_size20630//13831//16335//NITZ4_008657-RA/size20630-processed-gene-0.27-mRNA-1//-1//CDS//3329547517//57//frame0
MPAGRVQDSASRRDIGASLHFGVDELRNELGLAAVGDATWKEVYRAFVDQTPQEWCHLLVGVLLIIFCLYFLGLGLELLSGGATVFSTCFAAPIVAKSENAFSDLMSGLLLTVLLQGSSSTFTLVVNLLRDDHRMINMRQAIFIMMGANIGTTITNTIVALGHFRHSSQLELAFAGATVHDLFNIFTVLVLFPLEAASGFLESLSKRLVTGANTEYVNRWLGPVQSLVRPLAFKLLIPNEDIIHDVAAGGSCSSFYPIECINPDTPTFDTCPNVGLISCDPDSGDCPSFFDPSAGQKGDQASGLVVLIIGLVLTFLSLFSIVHVLSKLLHGVSLRVLYKATNINGWLLILFGTGLTLLLQSSSMTVSFLTPVVGMGALRIRQMYPLSIGANLGTAISVIITVSSMENGQALQLAVAHFLFNTMGILIWYALPPMRHLPLTCAKRLGQYAKVWHSIAVLYVLMVFFVLPGFLLGLSTMYTSKETGLPVVAVILTTASGLVLIFGLHWCYFRSGRSKIFVNLRRTRRAYDAKLTLPSDMDRIKDQLKLHQIHAGIVVRAEATTPRMENVNVEAENDAVAPVDPASTSLEAVFAPPPRPGSSVQDDTSVPDRSTVSRSRARRRALRRLSGDMDYVNTAISMLQYHTGLLDESERVQIDQQGVGVSVGGGEDHAPVPNEITSRSQRDGTEDLGAKVLPVVVFYRDLPHSFRIKLLLALFCSVVAIVTFHIIGGKAAKGAAGLICVMWALGILYFLGLWFSIEGRLMILTYLHNRREQRAYLRRLPADMIVVKVQVKELLVHYGLTLDEDKFTNFEAMDDTSLPDDGVIPIASSADLST